MPKPDRFTVIRDALVVADEQFMINLPSSRADFALFVSERDRAKAEAAARASAPDAALEAELQALVAPESIDTDDYTETADEPLEAPGLDAMRNTTSVTTVRREADRRAPFRDIAVRLSIDRPLAAVLEDNGLESGAAQGVLSALDGVLSLPDPLPRGTVLGLRFEPLSAGGERLSQISVYVGGQLSGTALLDGLGSAVVATDPWLGRNLPAIAGTGGTVNAADGKADDMGRWRLMDAIYSAAIRAGVPTELAGELISILSQSIDLDRTATSEDRVTLAFSAEPGPGGQASGQWLYVGTDGPSGRMDCYVTPDKAAGGYRCSSSVAVGSTDMSGGQFRPPVQGVMSSRFGMRKHPILKTTRLHAGLDWAAPVGTPVRAAAAGKVIRAGDADGYGNLVVLAHPDGFETRYAHLDSFADGMAEGAIIQAGQEIGTVGMTGLSTGPHLHFELRRDGAPIDPLPFLAGGALSGSDAVEALVARIIEVESGNNAAAKNPKSTATGLGQFVEQTWLQMMRRYRPELAASLSTTELLALRTDPTLSREMVRQLARDNEDHLRAAGHEITAGRLYLAHFLGAEGANTALSADDDQTVMAVMGARVVNANPFLSDYTIADLKAWADRKMRGAGGGSAISPAPAVIAPEVAAFIALVDQVLAETDG